MTYISLLVLTSAKGDFMKRKRVIGYYPVDMLEELEREHEISFDSLGRVRGFVDFVERSYRRKKP